MTDGSHEGTKTRRFGGIRYPGGLPLLFPSCLRVSLSSQWSGLACESGRGLPQSKALRAEFHAAPLACLIFIVRGGRQLVGKNRRTPRGMTRTPCLSHRGLCRNWDLYPRFSHRFPPLRATCFRYSKSLPRASQAGSLCHFLRATARCPRRSAKPLPSTEVGSPQTPAATGTPCP